MKWIRTILFPVVPIYYLVTSLRNWLYDKGIKASKTYDFPVLCVGNLSVGGTGKTPVIEYLIRLLKADYQVATLSRGYKRTSEGFLLADDSATADTLGDEPFQFYNKFKTDIKVAVDANRQRGIERLKALVNPDVVLLDDAFQHRKVKAGLNILLTVFDKLYVEDWMLPTGNLREPISGAKRAHIIVVTKCPSNLSETQKKGIVEKLKIQAHQHVFFSHISYSEKVYSKEKELELKQLVGKKLRLVTGIANPIPFMEHLKNKGLEFEHLNFPDHHVFSVKDIKLLEKQELILTTEKDYMRLKNQSRLDKSLFYLPIEFTIDNASSFDTLIRKFLAT